jgi:diaminopimelate decarboxylase
MDVWPGTPWLEPDGEISIGGLGLSSLAPAHGTRAYIIDEGDVPSGRPSYAAAFPDAATAQSRMTASIRSAASASS